MKIRYYISICLGFCHGRWIRRLQKEREKVIVYSNFSAIDWTCGECGEWREDDARVEVGMKCGFCAYGYYNGGE